MPSGRRLALCCSRSPRSARRTRANPQRRLGAESSRASMRGSATRTASAIDYSTIYAAQCSPSLTCSPAQPRTIRVRCVKHSEIAYGYIKGRNIAHPSGDTSTRSTQLPPPLYDQPLSSIWPSWITVCLSRGNMMALLQHDVRIVD